jgi:hypothetical protein
MYLNDNKIIGVNLDVSPDTESVSDAFVPVLSLSNAQEFDYDSKEGWIYWVQNGAGK